MAFLRWKFPAIIDDHDDIIQRTFTNLISSGLKNFKGTTKYEFLLYFKTIVRNKALRGIEDQKKKGRFNSGCAIRLRGQSTDGGNS